MGGARFTLEFADIDCDKSPAKTLLEKYGVAYKRLASPVGLQATDILYEALAELAGTEIPQEIK